MKIKNKYEYSMYRYSLVKDIMEKNNINRMEAEQSVDEFYNQDLIIDGAEDYDLMKEYLAFYHNVYAISKEKLSIDKRIIILREIRDYYIEKEDYDLCTDIKNLISDYKSGDNIDVAHIKYSMLIEKYITEFDSSYNRLL